MGSSKSLLLGSCENRKKPGRFTLMATSIYKKVVAERVRGEKVLIGLALSAA
jgi:hypothetical protein